MLRRGSSGRRDTSRPDDKDAVVTLTSDEARELAAMLWHHADEADRRMGLR